MEKPHLPGRDGKVPYLIGGVIGPRTETCINLGGPIAMVLCLHQGIVYIKRKRLVWRAQKCTPLLCAETQLTCAGRKTTPSHAGRYRAEIRSLRKLGWIYRHGTTFAPRQYFYLKEATAMERTEMYSTSRWKNPTYLCGPANYPTSWGTV